MKTSNLLFAAFCAATTLNFSSCKEDKEPFDNSFENCVSEVGELCVNGLIGDERKVRDRIAKIELPVTLHWKFADKERKNFAYGAIIKIGTSPDSVELYKGNYELKPFTTYYVTGLPWLLHRGQDTVYGELQNMKFYAIPNYDLQLSADYGDGEIASIISWNLKCKYVDGDDTQYYDYEGPLGPVTVTLKPDLDTVYKTEPIELPANTVSCCLKQGGTPEKPDYPAYINKYWQDGKTIMRYEPIFYNIGVSIEMPLGDETTTKVSNKIKSIFMDKQSCVCDNEFNIYRIAKIGNQTWTIDNYRGKFWQKTEVEKGYAYIYNVFGVMEEFVHPFGGSITYQREGYEHIPGYHFATEDDYKRMLYYYGIEYPTDTLQGQSNKQKLIIYDSTLQRYFTTGGAWSELMSSYGWTDDNGDFINQEQGAFNAVPVGYYDYGGVEGIGKFAAFSLPHTQCCLVVSRQYQGVAKIWYENASLRFVKNE